MLTHSGYKTFGEDPGVDSMVYAWAVAPAALSDDEVIALAEESGLITYPEGYYGGPGRMFAEPVHIRRGRTRVLLTQRSGLDV